MNYYVNVYSQAALSAANFKGSITSIKEGTFHANFSVSTDGKYRMGNVHSAYCEFDYYTSGALTVDVGDVFQCLFDTDVDKTFQEISGGVSASDYGGNGNVSVVGMTVTDDGNGNLTVSNSIGVTDGGSGVLSIQGGAGSRTVKVGTAFFVTSVKTQKNICHVIGYDAVSLLNKDVSSVLLQHKSEFPLDIGTILRYICQDCGLIPPFIITEYDSTEVNYFYADGITAREIVAAVADAFGYDVYAALIYGGVTPYVNCIDFADSRLWGDYASSSWNKPSTYVICPDNETYYQADGTSPATNVWYKENSLDIGYQESAYDGLEFFSSDGTSLGHYYDSITPTNIYVITNNVIIDNLIQSTLPDTFNNLAQSMLSDVNTIYPYSPISVSVFPFRCPYWDNVSTRLVDVDGTYYNFPIMSLDITNERVQIESFGEGIGIGGDYGEGSSGNGLTAAMAKIARLESLCKAKTITGTTNSLGNVYINLGAKYAIVSIRRTDASSMCIPFWDTSASQWRVHIMTSDTTPVASTNVSLDVVYYELLEG